MVLISLYTSKNPHPKIVTNISKCSDFYLSLTVEWTNLQQIQPILKGWENFKCSKAPERSHLSSVFVSLIVLHVIEAQIFCFPKYYCRWISWSELSFHPIPLPLKDTLRFIVFKTVLIKTCDPFTCRTRALYVTFFWKIPSYWLR